jgi:hypothetical protein
LVAFRSDAALRFPIGMKKHSPLFSVRNRRRILIGGGRSNARPIVNLAVYLALVLSVLNLPRALAELPKAERDDVVALIKDILPFSLVEHAFEVIRHPEVAGQDEVERQRNKLTRSKAAIPKLRKLIKTNTSVFEYPGLLSIGYISSRRDESRDGGHEKYRLYISATGGGREGGWVSPYEFQLYFDDRGIITEIDDVHWK